MTMWKVDPAVEEARRAPGWAAFHRVCGQRIRLAFDHMQRESRRGDYTSDAFTWSPDTRVPEFLVQGRGKTPIEAVADAYRKSGRGNSETDAALAVLLGEFDDLIGGPVVVDDFEDLIG